MMTRKQKTIASVSLGALTLLAPIVGFLALRGPATPPSTDAQLIVPNAYLGSPYEETAPGKNPPAETPASDAPASGPGPEPAPSGPCEPPKAEGWLSMDVFVSVHLDVHAEAGAAIA